MELKEIKKIISQIFSDIQENDKGLIYRKYDTFLSWFGMEYRRNEKIVNQIDYQLRKNNIGVWCGKEERFSVNRFLRGETITFRLLQNEPYAERTQKVKNDNAGTIEISHNESRLELYKHQHEAIQKLQDKTFAARGGSFAGILVLPTGGGKTLTAAYWLAKNFLDKDKKILWIAHRHELLNQAKQTFQERLAFTDIFKSKTSFNYRIVSGIHDKPVNIKPTDDIIFASKDSLNAGFDHLQRNWIKDGTNEIFLVIDEAHHATAKTYRRVIEHLRQSTGQLKMMGLTATPFRTAENEQGLLRKVFPDDIIYKIDLRTLISRGILSEPTFEEVKTEVNFARIFDEKQLDNIRHFDIDSLGRETARTISENVVRNAAIVNRYTKDRERYGQTIVFALNQDNAIALNKLFREQGVKSDYVLSAIKDLVTGVTLSRENRDKIKRFRDGELDVLINVNILTEGTDLPKVQSVFLARPTISTILMTQMIGRGLRGEKAGGTKETYIVSFIDQWQDKISWVNPEKLFIEENIDFKDETRDTRERLIRLISIAKIEEFASLSNQTMELAEREQLESVDFISRVPLGIYQFSFLTRRSDDTANEKSNEKNNEKNCEILIYDNVSQSYEDFIESLPKFFADNKLGDKDFLTDEELDELSRKVDEDFFHGCLKYPAYALADIENLLQFYAQNEAEPVFIEFKDREKFDLTKIAAEIIAKDMNRTDEHEFKSELWVDNQSQWKAFFGGDKRYFLSELDLAIRKLSNPDLYQHSSAIPTDTKELRELEKLSMSELREQLPPHWKELSDKVFEKFKDEDDFYYSAQSEFRSKNKLDFQIDHIIPMKNGGLTILENLQLLTRKENARKGAKE